MKGAIRERVIRWVAGQCKYKVIAGACAADLGPLLTRFYVLGGERTLFGVSLHRLWRSDVERHLHDHPWPFVSIILTGGYTEATPAGRRRFGPGRVLFRPARWQHKLEMDRPAWTLVVRLWKTRSWGFITENGWVHWERYDYNQNC